MLFSLLRSRRFLTILALVATGIALGNMASGPWWRAQVAPPAVCGNARCEIGERGTVRIVPPVSTETGPYGLPVSNLSFGRSVAYGGDIDNDGIPDLVAGSITTNTTYGNRGTIWSIALNQDGTPKSMNAVSDQNVSIGHDFSTYGSAIAMLGRISTNGQMQYAFNGLDYKGNVGVMVGDRERKTKVADFTAASIANIGDINGDGKPDLAIGKPGTVTIVTLSSTDGYSLEGMTLHTIPSQADGFAVEGLYRFGRSITALGDMNGDGKLEIAVGEGGTEDIPGKIWILSLNSDGTVASKSSIVPGTSFTTNEESDYVTDFGAMVTNIGDWDGDGTPDLAVSASAMFFGGDGSQHSVPIWILYLNRNGTVKNTRIIHSADLGAFGELKGGQQTFTALGSLPDLDGDGKQELLIGSANDYNCGGSYTNQGTSGAVHIFFSKSFDTCPKDCNWCLPVSVGTIGADPAQAPAPLYTLPTCNNGICNAGELNPMAIPGPYQTEPYSGPILTMSRVGLGDLSDLDGDGGPDIVLSGPTQNTGLDHWGEAAVVFLRSNGALKSLTRIYEGAAGFTTGHESAKHLGSAVAVLGDVDNDGVKDIAVNASDGTQSGQRSIYILFLKRDGTVKGWKEITQQDVGMSYTTHLFGVSVTGLGDFNGDGIPDLAVGISSKDFYLQTSMPQDQLKGGRVQLLFLNRDGSVKSSKALTASMFYGDGSSFYDNDVTSDDQTAKMDYRNFGTTMASFGNLFGDGRRILIVNKIIIFLNADGSINSSYQIPQNYSVFETRQFSEPLSLANAGDMNGDGRSDLALVVGTRGYDDTTDTFFYSIDATGNLTRLSLAMSSSNLLGAVKPWMLDTQMLPAPFLITIPDLDGDQICEAVFLNNQSELCPTLYGSWGTVRLTFSAENQNICPDDCSSVNICSDSYGLTVTSSSSSSSSSHSSSSVSLPPAICANGEMEPGEECEIGYSCLTGYTCTASCACSVVTEITSSSSSTTSASSSSATSSSSSSTTSASSSSATSSSSSLAATTERCGNGLLEGSEVCEAGHSCGAGRYCSNCQCYTPAYCGDLVVNAANNEECEADDDCPTDQFCTLNCLCHADTGGNCGNGNLEAQEECERNYPCGDGAQCQSCVCVDVARCGNSSLERGEQCEVNDACPTGSSCVNCLCEQSVGCGNGILSAGEQCEQDSHCATGQYCNLLSCRCQGTSTLSCGNGVLDAQEQCDLGQPCQNIEEICDLANCSCLLDAVTTLCGNAQVDSGEDCDIGTPCAEDEICNFSGCHCIPWEQRCGDAELSGDEECEIGSPCADPSKACDLSQCVCATPSPDQVCGNGGIEVGEECEVGMACPFGWSCDFPRCRCQNQPVCGDAMQNLGEQCEINMACSSSDQTCDFSRCRCVGNLIRCGNGVLDPGEQCDDGNTMDNDGCGATCQREWAAMVGGTEACGNGIADEGEQCDDGNTRNGDGCSQSCQWEMSVAGATQSAGVGAEHGAGSQGIYAQQSSSLAGGVTMPGGAQVAGGAQTPGGMQAQAGLQTIVFPGGQGWGAATQQGQSQQYYPSFYGSVTPYVTPSGPVGNTGPASVAVIAAGAAAGFAWARRKRKM